MQMGSAPPLEETLREMMRACDQQKVVDEAMAALREGLPQGMEELVAAQLREAWKAGSDHGAAATLLGLLEAEQNLPEEPGEAE